MKMLDAKVIGLGKGKKKKKIGLVKILKYLFLVTTSSGGGS